MYENGSTRAAERFHTCSTCSGGFTGRLMKDDLMTG